MAGMSNAEYRKEMLEKLQALGACSLKKVEVLETILYYTMPRTETKTLAYALIEKFGDFANVLNAPKDQLLKVEGMKKETAALLNSIPQYAQYYIDDMQKDKSRIYNTEVAVEMLRKKFIGKRVECLAVMLLDTRGKVLFSDIVWQGAIVQVPVYVRDIVGMCISYNADTIIIAHNHTSGNPAPSRGDLTATKELQLALNSIYVNFEDHLIFTEQDYLSLKKSGWLVDLETSTDEFRKNVIMTARQMDEEMDFERQLELEMEDECEE